MSENKMNENKMNESDETLSLCRICSSENGVISIHERKINELTIIDMLNNFLNLNIRVSEKIPSCLCNTCCEKLLSAYQFKQEVEKIERKFIKLIPQSSQMVIKQENIDHIIDSNSIECYDLLVGDDEDDDMMDDNKSDSDEEYVPNALIRALCNTTNTNKHVKLTPVLRSGGKDENDASKIDDYEANEIDRERYAEEMRLIRENIEMGVYKISRKRGTSRAWSVFGCVMDNNNKIIKGYIVCRVCHFVSKHNPLATSSLLRHKCVLDFYERRIETLPQDKEDISEAVIKFCIKNCIPFNVINRHAFVELIAGIVSSVKKYKSISNMEYLLPPNDIVMHEIIMLRNQYIDSTREKIQSIKTFSVTADFWTIHSSKIYMSLKIHYIDGTAFGERLLAVRSLNPGENINEKISEIFTEYSISNPENVYVVINPNVAIENKIANFPICTTIVCTHYVIDTILDSSISTFEPIHRLLYQCQCCLGTKPKYNLKWQFAHDAFKSVIAGWKKLSKSPHAKDMNVNDLIEISKFLDEFKIATFQLRRFNVPTLHDVYPMYLMLFEFCNVVENLSPLVATFKTVVKNKMIEIWWPNIRIEHRVALFIFPLCKSLTNLQEQEKEDIFNFIERLTNVETQTQAIAPAPAPSITSSTKRGSNRFARFFVQKEEKPSNVVREEITSYMNEPIDPSFINATEWWYDRKNTYKYLYRIFERFMCIPATNNLIFWRDIFGLNISVLQDTGTVRDDRLDSILVLNSNMRADNTYSTLFSDLKKTEKPKFD